MGGCLCFMSLFKLHSSFKPAGDQPEAIRKLISGIEKGFDFQTLMGVTGSGKTFTIANIIEYIDKPVLVIAPNKSLAAQLYREYKNFFQITQFIILFLIMIIINQKHIYQLQILILIKKQ